MDVGYGLLRIANEDMVVNEGLASPCPSPFRCDDLVARNTNGSNIGGVEFRTAIGDRFDVVGFKLSLPYWPMAFPTSLTCPLVTFEYPYPEPGPVSAIPESPRMFSGTKPGSSPGQLGPTFPTRLVFIVVIFGADGVEPPPFILLRWQSKCLH